MASFLDRYYALILALVLPAPLWFGSMLRDGIIWSSVLLALWLLWRNFPRYRLRGQWRRPTEGEFTRYFRLMLAVLIIDFGSKALFFRWDRPDKVELFKNFGLHSVFHPTEFDSFHVYLLLYLFYLFMIAPLYFRLANRTLDRLWITFCAVGVGGTLALVTERLLFDGVHNSFYFAGPLMWLCPPCASPRFISYAWTPADFFCHAIVLAISFPIAAYFAPSSSSQRGTPEPGAARSTLLRDNTP
jgi:hypothetical protein